METKEAMFQTLPKEAANFLLEHRLHDLGEGITAKKIAGRVKEGLINLYGTFIPEQKRIEKDDVANRIVLLNEDDYDEYVKRWWPGTYGAEKKTAGHYYRVKNFIVINNDSVLRAHKENPGYSYDDILGFILGHEISHAYENKSIPETLREIACQYYAQEAVENVGLKAVSWGSIKKQARLYEEIIQEASKAGISMHKVLFDSVTEDDWKVIRKLLNERSDVVRKEIPELLERSKYKR